MARLEAIVRFAGVATVGAFCMGSSGSGCGGATTLNEVEIIQNGAVWKRTVGNNGTYGWDEPDGLKALPAGAFSALATLRGSGPRDFFVFTSSNIGFFYPGKPVVSLGMRWAKTGGWDVTTPTPFTVRTRWDVGAARLIDHGACRIEYATVKNNAGTGPNSSGAFVRSDSKATWFANDPNHSGFLVDIANTINAQSHEKNARRIGANFQTMFAKYPRDYPEDDPNNPNAPTTNPQIDGNVVNDGMVFDFVYNGCDVASYIPPGIPVYVCANVKAKAAYQLFAEGLDSPYWGLVRARPLYVEVDTSDIPKEDKAKEQKEKLEKDLNVTLPEKLWLQVRGKLSLPSTAIEAGRGHAWCLEPQALYKGGPTAPRMLAGLYGLLASAIKTADGLSKADADKKAEEIILKMDYRRIYYHKDNYDNEDEAGMCKYSFEVKRVNVLPSKLEFVLVNDDVPMPPAVQALGYLSPGDLNCKAGEFPVFSFGEFNAVYSAGEEKWSD